MSYGRAQPRIVLKGDAADSPLNLVGIFFVEVFHDIKLYVAPALGSETVDREGVAHSLERFAHQNQTFLFNFDDAPSRARIWLQRMPTDRARRGRRLIQQEGDSHVATPAQTLGIKSLGLMTTTDFRRPSIDDVINHSTQIKFLAV